MSCFWQALCREVQGLRQHSPATVVRALQSVNCPTASITWNGKALTSREVLHNMEWVAEYNPSQVNGGHDTSILDPFLALVCEVFAVNIDHTYTGPSWVKDTNGKWKKGPNVQSTSKYVHPKPKQTVRLNSNLGHMN